MKKLVCALFVAAAASACSFEASVGGDVSGDKLAPVVSDRLAEQVGERPDSVECPDKLEAEKGATTRCTLEAQGSTYDVLVTTTGVKDGNVSFDIEVVGEK